MELPLEKGQLGPQPPKRLQDGVGGDGAGSGPKQPSPSHTSRVSFSSDLQVQLPQSPAPAARGDRSSRHSRLRQSSRSRASSARLPRGQRSAVGSPAPLPPPANTAARQGRRLRSCVACSGNATPDTCSTVPSTSSIPALTEIEPLLVHQLTQTEPETAERSGAAERVDRHIQTESPARERRSAHVRLFMERETQTQPAALPLSAAPAARGAPEPLRRRQRLSLLRRLLRACRCYSGTRAQPEQLGAGPGPKTPQHPQGVAHMAGIGVLMVIQEATECIEWSPYSSWPWLAETSL